MVAISLLLAAGAHAEELQPLSGPSLEAPDLSAEFNLLPDKPAVQEISLPFSSRTGTLTLGAYNLGTESDAPSEKAGVSLAGSTATEQFNLNGAVDLSQDSTALNFAIQPKDNPATVGLLYLYDQADKANSHKKTPLMILSRIGNSLLFSGQNGGEMELVGMYADYAISKDVGIHWAMGYAAVNNEEAALEGKAWEYNVGVAYNFFKNFMYEAHFGYMTADETAVHAVEQLAAPVEEVYMMTNNIRMQF